MAGPGRHRGDGGRAQRRRQGRGRARRPESATTTTGGSWNRGSTAAAPSRCSPTSSTRPSRWRSTRTGPPRAARTRPRCCAGSATASARSTSRTAAWPPTPPARCPPGRAGCRSPDVLAAAPDALRVIEFDAYDGDLFEAIAASHAFLTGDRPVTGGPVGVGIIGAGVISGTYLENLTSFPDVRVLRVADLDVERAAARAAEYGVPRSGTVAELLADPGSRDRRQPDHPGFARRRRPRRPRSGQARLGREAPGPGPPDRPQAPRSRTGEEPARGQRARHRPRRRAADRPPAPSTRAGSAGP